MDALQLEANQEAWLEDGSSANGSPPAYSDWVDEHQAGETNIDDRG